MHAHFYPPERNDCRTEGIVAKKKSEINTSDERRSAGLVAQSRRRFPGFVEARELLLADPDNPIRHTCRTGRPKSIPSRILYEKTLDTI
jgi:hypothetical protein